MVPEVVIGLPDTVNPVVPPLTATDVTVPEPPAAPNVRLPEPSVVSTCPFVPSVPGSVNVVLEEVLAD
jgi:hypothetical protein